MRTIDGQNNNIAVEKNYIFFFTVNYYFSEKKKKRSGRLEQLKSEKGFFDLTTVINNIVQFIASLDEFRKLLIQITATLTYIFKSQEQLFFFHVIIYRVFHKKIGHIVHYQMTKHLSTCQDIVSACGSIFWYVASYDFHNIGVISDRFHFYFS